MTKMTVVPEDFLSHHASWRAALERCIETAPISTCEMDDKAYWQHELRAFDRAYAALAALNTRHAMDALLQSPVAGMNGLSIEGALAADWGSVYGSLIQARDHLQKGGVRHTWLDGAIAVAESRAKVPVPDAYLGRESIDEQHQQAATAVNVGDGEPDAVAAPAP